MGVYRLHFNDGSHKDVDAYSLKGAGEWAVKLGLETELTRVTDPDGQAQNDHNRDRDARLGGV